VALKTGRNNAKQFRNIAGTFGRYGAGPVKRLLSILLVVTTPALAYEGASVERPQDAGIVQPKLTRAPEVLRPVDAVYPPDELAKGTRAEVALTIGLDAMGNVTSVEVARSGGEAFDAAAIEALRQFQFSGAEVDGMPAPIRFEYVVHFEPAMPVDAGVLEADAGSAPPVLPVNLRGRVLERGTRNPLPGAAVYVPDAGLSAEADDDGNFEVRGVPLGTAQVVISEGRHQKFETEVEIAQGKETRLIAYLQERSTGLFETIVVSEREKKEVSHRELKGAELATVPGTFGDPLRVIQNLPGVARAPFILGTLLVRGAQPEDSQVMIDGVPVPLLYHFAGGPSVLSPSYIDSIDFYPGAYGAKYGRAIAGVVDVTTGSNIPARLHGNASIDLLNGGLYVETPIVDEKFGAVSGGFRHSLIDLFLPALQQSQTRPGQASFVVVPSYWDYQGRYQIKLGGHRFELGAFGSNDVLKISQVGATTTQPFSLNNEQGFHRFRLRWVSPVADGWSASIAPTVGLTINSFNLSDRIKFSANSTDFNLRAALKREVNESLSFELGTDINANWFVNHFEVAGVATAENENPEPTVRDEPIDMVSYAAYLESLWAPFSRLKVTSGLRFEVYNLPKGIELSVEPRLALRLKLFDWLTAKGAWGIYRQAPPARQLDSAFGNPQLGLSSSHQLAYGLELKLPQYTPLSLDVQGYYNWRRNLVVSSNAIIDRGDGPELERLNNSGLGRAYGLEVLLRHELTPNFYGWIAYTLSRSEQWNQGEGRYVPMDYDQAHILTVVASYRFFFGLEVGLRFRLTTGRPTTPILGSVFDADSGGYAPVYGPAGSGRGATFNQLDLRLEKKWTYDWWKFSVYLDLQNLYNAPNPEFDLYDYRYRETEPLRGLPFLPTLGIKGEF
jgi:TonB family protein